MRQKEASNFNLLQFVTIPLSSRPRTLSGPPRRPMGPGAPARTLTVMNPVNKEKVVFTTTLLAIRFSPGYH